MGLGIDIEEIQRIRELYERFGQRFLERVFSAAEIDYAFRYNDPFPHLAARFAAKEAFVKASPPGVVPFCEIEVRNDEHGAPYLFVRGEAQAGTQVSLSHTRENAVAVVWCMELQP